jgi:hypothetical protein
MFHEKQPASPPDTDGLPMLNPRLFRTRDGRVWLDRMTRQLEVSLGPTVEESTLRYVEGQRDLIRRIKKDIEEAEKKEAKP